MHMAMAVYNVIINVFCGFYVVYPYIPLPDLNTSPWPIRAYLELSEAA